MEEDKKKELSSDAVELSGGFFYPEPRSTIVRVALPSFALLVIKGVLKALPSREWYGRPCRQSSTSPIRYEFFIFQLGQSKSLCLLRRLQLRLSFFNLYLVLTVTIKGHVTTSLWMY